jgi:hypothetical protein
VRQTLPETSSPPHWNRLRTFLAGSKDRLSPLLILVHDCPDPDALAAAMGLMVLVKEGYGIEARIAYGGEIGRMENRAMVRLLRIPVHKFRPAMLRLHAAVALVDTQPAFENNPFPANRRATLVIDQHQSKVPPSAECALVDPGCGATCVLVARALLEHGIPLSQRLANDRTSFKPIWRSCPSATCGSWPASRTRFVHGSFSRPWPGRSARRFWCAARS